jgi:hypothetical protein
MADGISILLLRRDIAVDYAQQRLEGKLDVVDIGIWRRK